MQEITSDRQWTRAVRRRDGDACRACGQTIPLHAHHIRPRNTYPELALELDNGITLCANCHGRLTGREDSTNLRAIIHDTRTAEQLTRLHDLFCDYLKPRLLSDDSNTRNDAVFQLFNQLYLYPDSLDGFLPTIENFLNRGSGSDVGLAEQMVVEFLRLSSNEAASQMVIEYEKRWAAEKHRRDAEPDTVAALRLLAESGDTATEYYLRGWHYANGRGVTQNDEKAVEWYHKAAEQGHAIAQYDLSWMYQHGRGVSPNSSSEAVKWCRRAAEQGYADAQNTLGWRYQYNRGVGVKNDEEAIKWYRKAAEQGHADAQDSLRVLSARRINREIARQQQAVLRSNQRHPVNKEADKQLAKLRESGDNRWSRGGLMIISLIEWGLTHGQTGILDVAGQWRMRIEDQMNEMQTWAPKQAMRYLTTSPSNQPTNLLQRMQEAETPRLAAKEAIEVMQQNWIEDNPADPE